MSDSSSSKNPPLFDWKAFEKILGQEVPLMLPEKLNNPRSSSWVSDYVQQLLHQAKLSQTNSSKPAKLDYELFQMKKTVICRIFLPEDTEPSSIRIKVSPLVLRIEGVTHPKKRHLINLPVQVITKTSKALYEDGVLEVCMPKNLRKRKYRDLFIEY